MSTNVTDTGQFKEDFKNSAEEVFAEPAITTYAVRDCAVWVSRESESIDQFRQRGAEANVHEMAHELRITARN